MFPESVHKKMEKLVQENQKILKRIKSESKNRPAKELKSIAESEGWWLDRTSGDHKIYKHNEYFEYPNYSGYITIDDCRNDLYPRQVRNELEKIFTPKQKRLIQEFISDHEVNLTLRRWLVLESQVTEASAIEQLIQENNDLREKLYAKTNEVSLILQGDINNDDTVDQNANTDDQDTLDEILTEHQEILDSKNLEIEALETNLFLLRSQIKAVNQDLLRKEESLKSITQSLILKEQEINQLNTASIRFHKFEQETIDLRNQLSQVKLEHQEQKEVLKQRYKKEIQKYLRVKKELELEITRHKQQISVKNTNIQSLQEDVDRYKELTGELQQNLNRMTARQGQFDRNISRRGHKSLWISSLIAAGVVLFNPGPNWLNTLAVFSIPSATLVFSSRKSKNMR